MTPADPNTIECGRCGRRYPVAADQAGLKIMCSCGATLTVHASAGAAAQRADVDAEGTDVAAGDEIPTGVTEQAVTQGMLWTVAGASGIDAYLLTESELRYKDGIAGSEKKFKKLMDEKGDINEVAKNKWTSTIPLDAIMKMERGDLDSYAVIHYTDKGRKRNLRVTREGTNLHALVYESVRAVLAPGKQTVKVSVGTWETIGPAFWAGLISLLLGSVLIALSFVNRAPTGKGWLFWWVATTLGTVGCVVVTGVAILLSIRWGVQRVKASPMKDVLVIRE